MSEPQEKRVEDIPEGHVYIRHPGVEMDALVPEQSVPMHRHAGWELVNVADPAGASRCAHEARAEVTPKTAVSTKEWRVYATPEDVIRLPDQPQNDQPPGEVDSTENAEE